MARERITLEELPGKLRRLTRNIAAGVEKGVAAGAREGLRILERATPKDTGTLRENWENVSDGRGGRILGNPTPYARNVELGSGPHAVSPEEAAKLRDWAQRHFRRVGGEKKWLRGKRRAAAVDNLIGKWIKKIETRGEKPTYFVRNKVASVGAAVNAEMRRMLDGVANRGTK